VRTAEQANMVAERPIECTPVKTSHLRGVRTLRRSQPRKPIEFPPSAARLTCVHTYRCCATTALRAALSLIEVAPGLNSVPRETLSIFKLSLTSLFFISLTREISCRTSNRLAWLNLKLMFHAVLYDLRYGFAT
jgi:hypothetical protein